MRRIARRLAKLYRRAHLFARIGLRTEVMPHRLEMLEYAMQYAKNERVPGSYFEFGVAEGLTFAAAYHLALKYATPIDRYFAFDSFQGFPELGEVDKQFERFSAGEVSRSKETFLNTLATARVPLGQVEIKEGWFKDTLTPQYAEDLSEAGVKASVAWIDCDLYESTKSVLSFVAPFLQSGTVVVFDDWYCYHADPQKGEQRAVSEFLASTPGIEFVPYRNFGIVGYSFIASVTE